MPSVNLKRVRQRTSCKNTALLQTGFAKTLNPLTANENNIDKENTVYVREPIYRVFTKKPRAVETRNPETVSHQRSIKYQTARVQNI